VLSEKAVHPHPGGRKTKKKRREKKEAQSSTVGGAQIKSHLSVKNWRKEKGIK